MASRESNRGQDPDSALQSHAYSYLGLASFAHKPLPLPWSVRAVACAIWAMTPPGFGASDLRFFGLGCQF